MNSFLLRKCQQLENNIWYFNIGDSACAGQLLKADAHMVGDNLIEATDCLPR